MTTNARPPIAPRAYPLPDPRQQARNTRSNSGTWKRLEQPARVVAAELKTVVVSEDGGRGEPCHRQSAGQSNQLRIEMPGPKLYVARIEPYRLSDLDRLIGSIRTTVW